MEEEHPNQEQAEKTEQLTKKQRRALKKAQKREDQNRAQQAKTAKTVFGWLGVVVVIILGLWWLVASSNSSGSTAVPPAAEVVAEDWTKGGEDAKAVIIEYSDFQCPACGAYFPIIKQITEEFGDAVQFAYRHFPLRTIHPNAEEAARASEAAGAQGKFWEMHDMLFQQQNAWSNERNPFSMFAGYAENLDLDGAQFEADYNSSATKDIVRAHETAGRRLGVAGTPTFVLNGEQITSPPGYEAFRSLLVSIVGEPEPKAETNEETATTTEQSQVPQE